MDKRAILDLLTYEAWATNKVIEAALPQADQLPEKFSEIMSHLLNARLIWYARMHGDDPIQEVWGDHPVEKWNALHQSTTRQLQQLLREGSEEDLNSDLHYRNSRSQDYINSRAEIFMHLILHGQYHRGQLVMLMKGIVDPLPATDYVFYKR